MTIWELKRMLLAAGADESSYFIAGIDERGPGKGGGLGELVVTRTEDESEWALRRYERGLRTLDERYATEDQVCQAAWAMLEPRPTVVRPRSPANRQRSAELAEKAKREYAEQEEAFRRERATRSSPDDG